MRNAVSALKAAKGGANVPYGIGPPYCTEAVPVALVKAVAIVANQIMHREPALNTV